LGNGVFGNIVTIKPGTVLAWHRILAARRIAGELRKLGKGTFLKDGYDITHALNQRYRQCAKMPM
jgi:hypothetical protein